MAKKAKEKSSTEKELAALQKKIEGQKDGATDAQKKEIKSLRDTIAAEKFVAVANTRVPKAMAAVKILANLGQKNYKSTPAQVDAILAALRSQVDIVEKSLKGGVSAEPTFKL